MNTPRFRAVILAAGLGTRLRPLTLSIPKPLLPVGGVPVIGHTLAALEKSGCEAVAINLHHLGEKIASRFGSSFEKMPLTYSREEKIRGTLGALAALRDFVTEAELVIVINGDSLSRWPVQKLLRHHSEHGPKATLMVTSRARPEVFGGGIGLARDGGVLTFASPAAQGGGVEEETRRRVFAGAHVFAPRLLEKMPESPSDFVRDLYQPMVDRGERIDAFESSELWFDLGTPRRYLEGVLGWAGRGGWRRRGWWSSEAEVDDEASVQKAALEAGVSVAAGARVRRSLILSRASIGQGCRVIDSIIGTSVPLPAGTVIESRLVTEARADTPPEPRASVVGGLVYSPLE